MRQFGASGTKGLKSASHFKKGSDSKFYCSEFEIFTNVMVGNKRIEYMRVDSLKNVNTSRFMCDHLPGNIPMGLYHRPIPENQQENDFFVSLMDKPGDIDSKGKNCYM